MSEQSILDLVKKPYQLLRSSFCSIMVRVTEREILSKNFSYLYDPSAPHGIIYEENTSIRYRKFKQADLVLRHFLDEPNDDGEYLTIYTPFVPSATIFRSWSDAADWLTEEWFGDKNMELDAETVIDDIGENGCVIYGLQKWPDQPHILANIDTNLGQYILPLKYLYPYFLDLSCFKETLNK